ncbi:DnaJ domain-containing protein [Bdellovibrio bacteriovorus]|uniref:DnaJ domain-containing protein n=1 Tax=Bdellovibrio bacteriovorus TaxID=959 RepID=UPI0035A5BD89
MKLQKLLLLLSLTFSFQTFAQTVEEAKKILNRSTSLYEVLGVSPNASESDIKNAYRRLVRTYHPDRFQGDPVKSQVMSQVTAKLNTTRDTLMDSNLRQRYDQTLKASGRYNTTSSSATPKAENPSYKKYDFGNINPEEPVKKTEEPRKQSAETPKNAEKTSRPTEEPAKPTSSAKASANEAPVASKTSSAPAATTGGQPRATSAEAARATKLYNDVQKCSGGFYKAFVDVMI